MLRREGPASKKNGWEQNTKRHRWQQEEAGSWDKRHSPEEKRKNGEKRKRGRKKVA